MKTDYMTTVQDKVTPMLMRLKAMVKDRVFLGPGVTKLDPRAALVRLQQMTPEERSTLVQSMGKDEFMSRLEALLDKAGGA